MQKNSKIISCIICDIARQEDGGKSTLLGVYPKSMAIAKFPAILPNLGIWVEILPARKKFNSMQFEILSPDKKVIAKGGGKLDISSIDYSIGLPIQLHNITFDMAGKYVIKFSLDGDMKKVAELIIIEKK